jgi:hypothetical protein
MGHSRAHGIHRPYSKDRIQDTNRDLTHSCHPPFDHTSSVQSIYVYVLVINNAPSPPTHTTTNYNYIYMYSVSNDKEPGPISLSLTFHLWCSCHQQLTHDTNEGLESLLPRTSSSGTGSRSE